MSTNCANCGHGIMEHTVPSKCWRGDGCNCQQYAIGGPEDDRTPQEAPDKEPEDFKVRRCSLCGKYHTMFEACVLVEVPEAEEICVCGDKEIDHYHKYGCIRCECMQYIRQPSLKEVMDAEEAPEMKETAMHALESLTPGGSEFYQDVARCKEWIQDRINTNWELAKKSKMEANSIRAAADKMAEAGWKALILLRDIQRDEKADGRTLTGRFEIIVSDLQATLSEYQKAVGK